MSLAKKIYGFKENRLEYFLMANRLKLKSPAIEWKTLDHGGVLKIKN
jgi:hypothetical protein